MNGPLERPYGRYRITFRKNDHVQGRPTPHVEVWKGTRKIGNFDMATGRPLFGGGFQTTPREIIDSIGQYLRDPQVQKKVLEAIQTSFFDLSKPAGTYGGIPRGFKATVHVEYTEDSLAKTNR